MGIEVKTFCPCNLDKPDFEHKTKVHDWRNHVPSDLQIVWKTLPRIAKICIVIMAEEQASAEEWD